MWLSFSLLVIILTLCFKLLKYFQKPTYANQKIWITGASSGIGEYLSYEFARQGGHILLSGRSLKDLQRVHEKIPNSTIVPLDLSSADSVFQKASEICKSHNIDILVNNAGISQRYLFEENLKDLDQERTLMEINFFSVVALTKAYVASLQARKGHVVVVSSVAGLHGATGRTGYSAAKSAILGYYESLRSELKEIGVRVTNLSPGFVNTNIAINSLDANGNKTGMADPFNQSGYSPEAFAKKAVKNIYDGNDEIIITQLKSLILYKAMSFSPALCAWIMHKIYTGKMKEHLGKNKKKC